MNKKYLAIFIFSFSAIFSAQPSLNNKQSQNQHATHSNNNELNKDELEYIKRMANPYNINYDSLDYKYYKYIKNTNYYDKDIYNAIQIIDKGALKTGMFIQLGYGASINQKSSSFYLINMSIGYDNFQGLTLRPNIMGYSLYADYMHNFVKNIISVSSINLDLNIEKQISNYFTLGISLGFGIGAGDLKMLDSSNYEPIAKINSAINFRFLNKNVLKIALIAVVGASSYLYNITPIIGYKYVF